MPPFRSTPSHLVLRPIQPGDAEALHAIFAATRQAERQQLGWDNPAWDAQWNAFTRQQFTAQHTQYMQGYTNASFSLVLHDGAVAGRLYVERTPAEIRIIDITLLPAQRGQGVARRLMQMLVDESDASGTPLGLHVERNNPAHAWYTRLGFVQQADRGVYLYLQRPPQPAPLPTPEALAALAGSSDFTLSLPGEPAPAALRLHSVTQQQGRVHTCSLHFTGPDLGRPAHATYTLAHPRLGRFQLFLGPVMGGEAGTSCYQAVITRLATPPLLPEEETTP